MVQSGLHKDDKTRSAAQTKWSCHQGEVRRERRAPQIDSQMSWGEDAVRWVKRLDGKWIERAAEEAAGADAPAAPAELGVLEGTPREMHGAGHRFAGERDSWAAPRRTFASSSAARPGYDTLDASEYHDLPDVLRAKVRHLARMLERARDGGRLAVVYAGAGLSTAAGISDYATHRNSAPGQEGADEARGATDSGEEEEDAPAATFLSPLCAQPTAAHRVLAGLVRESFVQRILQQNHDGLPQKAGVPQQHINEIHGALHAPDNPVVHMSGALRNDLYADMLRCEDDADVVIAVGTTLAGMNADRVVHSAARRAGLGRSQGAIIIGLQRTQHDQDATLRIFGRTDRVFRLLAQELGISASVTARRKHGGFFLAPVLAEARRALQQQRDAKRDPLPQRPVAELQVLYDEPDSHAGGPIDADEHAEYVVTNVPYDSIGQRSHSEAGALDLRKGSKLLIPSGPRAGAVGKVTGYDREGNPRCQFHLRLKPQPGSFKAPMESVLGTWWIQAASDGAVQQLPVVNVPAAEAQGEAAQAARKLMEAYAV